jgi:cytochrome c5
MSGNDNNHEEAHTGPIKTPKQLLVSVFFSFVVPIFAIIGLVLFVTSGNKPSMGSANPDKSLAMRIQKVGSVEVRDANRPLKAGLEVYSAQCLACHAAGAAGAPIFGDTAVWAPRLKQGLDALVSAALKGKGAMAAQGGGDFTDVEIARAVVHMANAAGGTFPIPEAPSAAVADAAAQPAQ